MEELGTRRTTERVRIGNSPPKVARACALLDHRRICQPDWFQHHPPLSVARGIEKTLLVVIPIIDGAAYFL